MVMTGYRCERCGHEWVPRGPRKENVLRGSHGDEQKPALCPNCKSPYWQTPKPAARAAGKK